MKSEEKRANIRRENDKLVSIGSKVCDFCYGVGTVVRINKKTYSIRFPLGSICPRDKSYVVPL